MLASTRCRPSAPNAVVEHLLERLAHQALAGVRLVRVVAEIGGLEGAADDLGDREDAGDLAGVGATGDQAQEVLAARAAVELVELVGALGRVGPRPVQAAALAGQREELRPVLAREHAQTDARAGGRRGGVDLRGADASPRGGGGALAASCRVNQSARADRVARDAGLAPVLPIGLG